MLLQDKATRDGVRYFKYEVMGIAEDVDFSDDNFEPEMTQLRGLLPNLGNPGGTT